MIPYANEAVPAPTLSELQAVTNRVWDMRAALGAVCDELTISRNRLFGEPPAAKDDGSVAARDGSVGQLHSALDVVEHEIARLNQLAPAFGRL